MAGGAADEKFEAAVQGLELAAASMASLGRTLLETSMQFKRFAEELRSDEEIDR